MKQKIVLHNEHHQRRALEVLKSIPLDPVHEILIREHKKDRSAAQFGLYWIWMGQISGYTGESKEEVHRRMKKKHLIPIYMEDPSSGMTETVLAVRDVHKKGMTDTAKTLESKIIDLVSTNDADVKQFKAYLEEIEKEAINNGIQLSHPEDLWIEAML